MKHDNDNEPQQIEVTDYLRHNGVRFPSWELPDFIEYDLKFGNPIYEYPVDSDARLSSGGATIKCYDERGRQVWVAVIAESGDECHADEWRIETYCYKHEALFALSRAQEKYVVSDWDEEGDCEWAA